MVFFSMSVEIFNCNYNFTILHFNINILYKMKLQYFLRKHGLKCNSVIIARVIPILRTFYI